MSKHFSSIILDPRWRSPITNGDDLASVKGQEDISKGILGSSYHVVRAHKVTIFETSDKYLFIIIAHPRFFLSVEEVAHFVTRKEEPFNSQVYLPFHITERGNSHNRGEIKHAIYKFLDT